MADRYWVGGAGTWNATSTTNWSASSGGASGASAPTSADNVIFNSSSNATLYTVTVGTNAVCADLTAAGPLVGNVTFSLGATAVINCYGSFTLPATGLTWTPTTGCQINFLATTTGKTITTNGVSLGNTQIIFNGSGGGWTLGSAYTATSSISVTQGTFNTGNFNVTVSGFVSAGSLTRSFVLGSSTITLSASVVINITQSANITFDAGTSQITCSNANPTISVPASALTYYNVSFTSAAAGTITITGANTFNDLTFTSRSATGNRVVTLFANQTVSGTLTLGTANTAIRRILVASDTIGTQRTITLNGTLAALADIDFRDINAAGTVATPWTGTRLGNCLGNANITFVAGKDCYRVGTGNWTATQWSLTSGGSLDVNNFPLAQDTMVFDTNTATGTHTIDASGWQLGSLNCSALNVAVTIASGSISPTFIGNITLDSDVTLTGTGILRFNGQGVTQNITSAGVTFTQAIYIECPNGTFKVLDTFNSSNAAGYSSTSAAFRLTGGTLDINNQTINLAGSFGLPTTTSTRVVAFGSTGKVVSTANNMTVLGYVGTDTTITGTSRFEAAYSGSTGTRTINNANNTEGQLVNVYVTAGSDIFSITGGSTAFYSLLDFTGFTGTVTTTSTTAGINMYGDLILNSSLTFSPLGPFDFAKTSGTQKITSAGKTFLNVTFGETTTSTATYELQDNLTTSSASTVTLTSGTLDLSSGNRTLSTGIFSSNNANTRSIAFGTGNITLTGNNANIWPNATLTNFSYTGTPTVNCTYSGSTGTRAISQAIAANGGTASNAVDFNISAGSDIVNFSTGRNIRNINFTGFSGTVTTLGVTIYGNLILSSGLTLSASISAATFAATSGTQQITTAGKTLDCPLTFNGIGGTFAFQDALTMGSTRTLTLSAGSLLFKSGTTNSVGNIVLSGNSSDNTRLSSTDQGFAAFLQKVVGGNITASNITIENSSVTPANTWFGNLTAVDGGGNTNWTFEQTTVRGHDAFLPQEIQKFKELDRKVRLAEANRVRAAKLVSYHRKRRFTELLAPELINPQEESFYEQLREQQFPEEVAKEKAEQAEQEATADAKAKVEAKKREIKKELKRLQKEEKEAAAKVVELTRQKDLLIDTVIARQKEMEIQAQLAVIYRLQQEEMEDEAALLLLI